MGFLPYLHDFWIVIKVSNFVCEKSSLSIWLFVFLHRFFSECAVKFEIFHLGFILLFEEERNSSERDLSRLNLLNIKKYSQEKYMSNLESLHLIYTNTKPYGRFARLMFSSISPFPPETRHKKLDRWLVSKPRNKYLFSHTISKSYPLYAFIRNKFQVGKFPPERDEDALLI